MGVIGWAEKNGRQVIDWENVVYGLKLKHDCYDGIKIEEYKRLAMEWDVCAVGQADYRIDRDDNGEPVDEILSALGVKFGHLLFLNKCDECLNVLKQINERVKEL